MDIKIGDLVFLDEGLGCVSQLSKIDGSTYYVISWCDERKNDSYTGKSSVVYGKEALQTYLDYADR